MFDLVHWRSHGFSSFWNLVTWNSLLRTLGVIPFPLFPHCIWMQKEIYVMRWYGGRMTTMWGRLHKHPELLSFLVGFITSVKAQLSGTSSPASISGSCTWAPLLAASTWLTKYRHVECCTVCLLGGKGSSRRQASYLGSASTPKWSLGTSTKIQFREESRAQLVPPFYALAPKPTVARRHFFHWGENLPYLFLIWCSLVFSLGQTVDSCSDL